MKKKKKRRTWIITMASLLVAGIAITGLYSFTSKKIKDSKSKIYYEMKGYINDSVLPVMKPLRMQLDNSLSASEKQKVEELRTMAKSMSDRHIQMFEKYHTFEKANKITLTDGEKEEIKQSQKKIRKIISECWSILDNHEAEFDAIHAQAMLNSKTWEHGIKRKLKKHMPFHGKHSHCKSHGQCGVHGQVQEGFITPVLFILWDTETNFPISDFQKTIEKHIDKK